MRQKLVVIGGAILSCLLLSCMDERISGNTTQTENTVTARSILVDSALPEWNHPCCMATVATLRLDSSNFDFSAADSAGLNLRVAKDNGKDSIPFNIVVWDKPARIGRVQVRIDWYLLYPGTRFLLQWTDAPKRRSDPVAVWKGIPDSQRMMLGSVLVDDFEGGSLKSKLPDSGSWYSAPSDSSVSVSATPGLVPAGAGRSGKAIHINYNAPNYKYALIGIALGAKSQPRSLRSLDSMVVYVRGSGRLGIAFDRLPPMPNKGKAWMHLNLDTGTWTRVRIRPDVDFEAADNQGGNIGWKAVRDSVTNLSFLVTGSGNLYVDDIRFYGVDRDDLK